MRTTKRGYRLAKQSHALIIPAFGLAEFVKGLADENNVSYVRTFADEWGDAVTKLADDEVNLDNTQQVLISLKRAGKISSDQMATILVKYLRERKARVRSV